MKLSRLQIGILVLVIAVNLLLWILPSDIIESVARNRQILLGRYSRRHMTWLIGLIPVSAIVLYLSLASSEVVRKVRTFRVLAVLMVLLPTVLITDVIMRVRSDRRFALGEFTYLRPPHTTWVGEFRDEPLGLRSYNEVPPGYGTIPWTLTTDQWGYRNPQDAEQSDVVIVGDSFVEGSEISDDHTLPVRFTVRSGVQAFNLGVSGYAPQHCLAALHEVGLKLQPKFVFYALYEGNDFRSAKVTFTKPSPWKRFFKRSPLIQTLDQLMCRALEPIGAQRHLACLEILDWLPLAVPQGPEARYYRFPPSVLRDHYVTQEAFENGKYWRRTQHNLGEMKKLCASAGVQFALVYIPTNAHTILPLVKDRLPADQVRAFVELQAKEDLPPGDAFLAQLLKTIDVMEDVTRDWCISNDVPFLSLTEPFRAAILKGRQVYLTYNDHLTPVGQDIAAESLVAFWKQLVAPTDSAGEIAAEETAPATSG